MAALHGAVARVEGRHVAVLVAHQLDLQVAALGGELHDEDRGAGNLPLDLLEHALHLLHPAHLSHPCRQFRNAPTPSILLPFSRLPQIIPFGSPFPPPHEDFIIAGNPIRAHKASASFSVATQAARYTSSGMGSLQLSNGIDT